MNETLDRLPAIKQEARGHQNSSKLRHVPVAKPERVIPRTHLAYITTDPTNFQAFKLLAAEFGLKVENLYSEESRIPSEDLIGVVWDLDFLADSPAERRSLIGKICNHSLSVTCAVHSYNLADEQIANLIANGVLVYRRLNLDLVDVMQAIKSDWHNIAMSHV